jgi:hypothetical protein
MPDRAQTVYQSMNAAHERTFDERDARPFVILNRVGGGFL